MLDSSTVLASTSSTLQQTRGSTLAPGIVGLFIQGVETGLVVAQLSSWFALAERRDSLAIVILTIFVTTVGL